MRPLVVTALAVATVTACGVPPKTSMRMRGTPPDAAVTVDDEYLGTLAHVTARGVALPPGKHRITVQKAGYFTWDKLVDAQGTLIQLDVGLTKVPE